MSGSSLAQRRFRCCRRNAFAGASFGQSQVGERCSGERRGACPFCCFVEELRWRQRSSRTSGTARTSVGSSPSSRFPNLIDIQKSSYDKFLQSDIPPRSGRRSGSRRLPERLPDQGFRRDERARLRLVQPREAEVRRRRVPPARHDVRRADQGDDAAHGLRHPRGRRAHRARHQGAGGLLRRDPADDGDRHLHHQRHRARRRLAAPPQPGRVLRSRQGQDALERQAPLLGAHHPVQRLVARLRVRPQGHHLRAHRPPPEDARHRAAPRARLQHAGAAQLLLLDRDRLPREGRQVREEHRVRPARRSARDARHQDRRRGRRQEEHQVHARRDQEAEGRASSIACRSSCRS